MSEARKSLEDQVRTNFFALENSLKKKTVSKTFFRISDVVIRCLNSILKLERLTQEYLRGPEMTLATYTVTYGEDVRLDRRGQVMHG